MIYFVQNLRISVTKIILTIEARTKRTTSVYHYLVSLNMYEDH